MRTSVALVTIVFIALLLSSCTSQHRQDMERIDVLRDDAERFVRAQNLMQFNSWAYGAPINQDSLYGTYAALFSRENISLTTRTAADEQDSLQRKRLHYFVRFLATNYIDRQIAPLTDRASNVEATAMVTVGGRSVPYRQVLGMIANERQQSRRAMLYRSEDQVMDSLNIMLWNVEEKSIALARDLGYPSYIAMSSDLKGYSLDDFRATAEHALSQTDSLYSMLLREMLRRYVKLTPEQFHRYDALPLFRNTTFDRYFPAKDMLTTLSTAYRGLGADIASMKNLTIDTAARPAKNPRAACFAIEVPSDVRLSMKPIGGYDDYGALFHEMGHALHYASTKENSFEFKYAGEPTVTESYAFLSEYLLTNQAWLRIRKVMPTPVMKDYIRFMAFYRIWYIRRYCAKFLYEMYLHSGGSRPDSVYAAMQSRAIGYVATPSDAKRYLTDVDEGFYSAGYLRAWFLESQINASLSSQYGVNWFEHPKAGETLRTLWSLGDRLDGDELVRRIGNRVISPAAWLEEIKAMIVLSNRE